MQNENGDLVLVIDDELYVRESISMYFEDLGFNVVEAENGHIGMLQFSTHHPDLVLCDLRMPEMDGLEVLRQITSISPETPVIVISGAGRIQDAVDALRQGAWNFVTKPVEDMAVLKHVAEQALEKAKLQRENRRYHQYLEEEVVRRTRQLAESTAHAKVLAEEAKAASRAKGEFLANMSHELRTPLNSISVLSRVLAENRDGNLTARQLEMLEQISSSGHELLGLVNEVLEVTSLESSELRLEMKVISVPVFVHKLERIISPLAWEKGLDYEIVVSKDAPETFYSDVVKASRIVRNLISNAVKFTEKGKVVVQVEAAPECVAFNGQEYGAGEALLVRVVDTGVGIPPALQKQIFNMFKQVDGADTRKYQGTGLGLTIASRFAAALGGDIWVESEEGKGSAFSVVFPVRADLDSREIKMVSRTADSPYVEVDDGSSDSLSPLFNGERVLVADTDMRLVFNMSALLESFGAEVLISTSSEGLMQRLQSSERIDLVIMHLRMICGGVPDDSVAAVSARAARTPMIVVRDSDSEAPPKGLTDETIHWVNAPPTSQKILPLIKQLLW